MLQPKRTTYRKSHRGRWPGQAGNLTRVVFGTYGLQAMESGTIPAKTLEAIRRVLTRRFRRTGQIWIRLYPDVPITRKPGEVRMGKGKGAVAFWTCKVQAGQILFEMDGVTSAMAHQAAALAHYKLPLRTACVTRD
jgi:large subunit ribosomal protein L16